MTDPRLDAMADAVEALVDLATERHSDGVSGETFVECHLCAEWDGHTLTCPIPALTAWLSAPGFTFALLPATSETGTPAQEHC